MAPVCRPFLRFSFLLVAALRAFAGESPPKMVGTVDFFGLRKLAEADIRAHLNFKEGDPFHRQSADASVRDLEKLPGVQQATLASITTDGTGRLHLFVGILETGSKGFALNAAPTGAARLPAPLSQAYQSFMAQHGETVRRQAPEDESQGHSLSSYPPARQTEEAAIALMRDNVPVVRDVLRNASSGDDRTAAAWLLGYAPDKAAVTGNLTDAARDPEMWVRNNATRSLGSIAVLAAANPKLGIHIDPTVFIGMLDSVTWTDRNKASFVFLGLTATKPPELMALLRQRTLPDLIEMARWKSDGHAFAAVIVLGRIAGWPDGRIYEAMGKGNREDIIAAAQSAH